jgi:hypothetical protein
MEEVEISSDLDKDWVDFSCWWAELNSQNKWDKGNEEIAKTGIHLILILILTVSNPYKYHSFSFIFHLASSLALKGGEQEYNNINSNR